MARILVVDDDVDVAHTIEAILSSCGHNAVVESDSERVQERISSESFDLIISDLFMPQFDGLEMVLAVRQSSPNTPILIVTGGSRYFPSGTAALQDITSSAELFGASAILQKPFKRSELLEAIEKLLSGGREN